MTRAEIEDAMRAELNHGLGSADYGYITAVSGDIMTDTTRAELVKAWDEAKKAWDEANKARIEAYKAWVEANKARVEADKAWVEADKALREYDDSRQV